MIKSYILLFFWPLHVACEILVPQSVIEPMTSALEVWSLNHWAAREVPKSYSTVWILFIHSPVDGIWVSFAIMKNAAMNILVQVLMWTYVFISLEYRPIFLFSSCGS